MAKGLEELEERRRKLLKTLSETDDMRRGSISETYRGCGKANCACASPGHRGHGPYYAFTRKVAGKTQTIQLRVGPELDKLLEEVRIYHEFRDTVEKLVAVNEEICKQRPVTEKASSGRRALKKKLPRSSRWRSQARSSA